MFAFGGFLKLLGDLTALVGPLSITLIVEYIEMSTAELKEKGLTNGTENRQHQQSTSSQSASSLLLPTLPSFTNAGWGVFPNGSINLSMQYPSREMKQPYHYRSAATLSSPSLSSLPLYYPSWSDFIANGWIMAVLVLFASLAQGSLSQMSTHIVNMVGIRIRTSLQSLVYRKTLLISSNCFFTASTKTTTVTPTVAPATAAPATMDDGKAPEPLSTMTLRQKYNVASEERKATSGSGSGTTHATAPLSTNNSESPCDDGYGVAETAITSKTEWQRLPPLSSALPPSPPPSHSDGDSGGNDEKHQQFIDAGAITNLMADDALNVMSFLWIAHYVWAIPFKVCMSYVYTYIVHV